ncbi:MAG: hypothetical protein HGA78_08540 [Nitrospirales bacterium]|nr:hypothetical protein [Nitrospirales bacterium]
MAAAGTAGMTASVQDSGITNELSGNQVASNISNGMILGNALGVIGYSETDSVTGSVVNGSITNTVADNSTSNNGANGLILANILGSAAAMTIPAPGALENGTPTGTVSIDSSAIANTITGNTVGANEANGMIVINALASAQLDTNSPVTDLLVGLIGGLISGGIDLGNFTAGLQPETVTPAAAEAGSATMTGSVTASEITNTISENAVNGNRSNGLILGNLVGTIAAIGSGSVAGDVTSSSITNTVTDNSISNNGTNGLIQVNLLGDILLQGGITIDEAFAVATAPETEGATISGTVDDGMIVNTVTGNTVNGNGANGIILGSGIGMIGLSDASTVTGGISNSSVSNTVENNSASDNGSNGLILVNVVGAAASMPVGAAVPAVAAAEPAAPMVYVENSEITNNVTGNTVGNNGDMGMMVGNALGVALTDPDSPAVGLLITDMLGLISGTKTLDDIIEDFGGTVDMVEAKTSVAAQAAALPTSLSGSVSGSMITNSLTDNTVENNGAGGAILGNALGVIAATSTGSVTAETKDSSITNTIGNNTISMNKKGNGLSLYNALGDILVQVEEETSTMAGTVSNSFITNEIRQNRMNDNDISGLEMSSFLGVDSSGDNGGSVSGSVTGSAITDTLVDNEAMQNKLVGMDLAVSTYAPDTEVVDVALFMQGNKVTGNQGGLYLSYDIAGPLDANIGDAGSATAGNNSFFGNTLYDLNNEDVPVEFQIKAENNWWGQNSDPGAAGQITNPGNVDFTPWLTTAP